MAPPIGDLPQPAAEDGGMEEQKGGAGEESEEEEDEGSDEAEWMRNHALGFFSDQIVDVSDLGTDTIHGACGSGDLDAVKRLIEGEPQLLDKVVCIEKILDSKDSTTDFEVTLHWTPLMCATVMGHYDVVEWMLDRGADPYIKDEDGDTVLSLAFKGQGCTTGNLWINRSRPRVMEFLLQRHPNLIQSGLCVHDEFGGKSVRSFLHTACLFGQPDLVKFLVEHGAVPSILDDEGHTPLSVAKRKIMDLVDVSDYNETSDHQIAQNAYVNYSVVGLYGDGYPEVHRSILQAIDAGRLECRKLLEVSHHPHHHHLANSLPMSPVCIPLDAQEYERSYLIWKACEVADRQGDGAVTVVQGGRGGQAEMAHATADFVIHRLKKELIPQLMEFMG
jgi:ankyrin repeat protein